MTKGILRPMTSKDGSAVSRLIVMAIEDLAEQFTKATELETLYLRIQMLIDGPETRFSAGYGLVVEEGGAIAGAGFAYSGKTIKDLTENMIQLMKSKGASYHVDEERRLIESKEANEDEFYIDNLAVFENFRGKSYSRFIIEAFEKKAREEGFMKISILADLHNPKAKAIYEGLGYVPDSIFRVLGHDYHHMVKILN